MKKAIAFFLAMSVLLTIFCFPITAYAGYVKGYFKKNGTYVQGYNRSNPNQTVTDNYSYQNNLNPYTGETGSDHYVHSPTSFYYEGPSSLSLPSLPAYGPPTYEMPEAMDNLELELGRADGN